MPIRFTSIVVLSAVLILAAAPLRASFCVPGSKPAQPDPAPPASPVCEPKKCDRCSKSPCYLATGMYVDDYVDLQIPTTGTYPLTVSRRYDSSRASDGPIGAGWSLSLTARLYYAAYLLSAPSTYSYEADVAMPDGVTYQFTIGSGGTFTPPFGRLDTLVRNGDGTYSLTPQRTHSVYRFNADGSLASLTDEFGNVIAYTYDAAGRIQQVADGSGSGRFIAVTWGPDGRVASLTDNAGRILKYFYEALTGTLTSYSDALTSSDSSNRTTYYSYVSGRFGPVLSQISDRWRRTVTALDWYSDGKLKSYTDGAFNDPSPSSSSGEKYVYTYTPASLGGQVAKAGSLGTTFYAYSASGLVNDQNTYDTLGNVVTESNGYGVRSYVYIGPQWNIYTVTDSAAVWWYTYDTNFPDKVASIIPKDADGNPSRDWGGWAYDYNPPGSVAAGALAAVSRIRTDQTSKDRIAVYTYDAHGHVLAFTDDNILVTTYTYTAAGDPASISKGGLTTSFTYDAIGRETSVTSPDGQVTAYTYDPLGRVTSVTLPKPAPSSSLNFVTTYSYDNYDSTTGLLFTNATDPNGRVTKSGYDVLGHQVQAIDAAGNVTAFTYQYNLLTKITDANANVTTYTYNSARELSAVSFPDGTTETYNISNGVLFSKTDRKGQQVVYSYDGLGRILSVVYPGLYCPGGGNVGQFYDYFVQGTNNTLGQNLTGISDQQPNGVTSYQFTYDSSWRRTVSNILGGEKTTYTYASGPANPVSWAGSLPLSYEIDPAFGAGGTTQTVSYAYDDLGRAHDLTWSWTPNQPFIFNYLPNGQYGSITFPNGQSRTFTYDNQARLTNVTNRDISGGVLASFDYGYDLDWPNNTYSMLGQRTSMTVTAVPGTNITTGVTKYQYDSRYQLTRTDWPTGYDTWIYDAIGNRTASRAQTFTYFKNGQNPLNGQRLRSLNGSPDLSYDAAGNLTGYVVAPNNYGWDYAGRLTSAFGTSYTYDYLGRRTTTTAYSTTTRYISLGQNTVGERNTTSGISNDYLFGPGIDEPLAKHAADGTVSYYGVDALGSIVLVTDANGTVTDSSLYDSWGTRGGGSTELFGFTGREVAGSLWYYRARYYDPSTGRFISEDPLQEHLLYASLDAYAYADRNPVSYDDPFGLDCHARVLRGARQVTARDIRWSGWEHSTGHQELPHDLEDDPADAAAEQAAYAGGYDHGPASGQSSGFGIVPWTPQKCMWVRFLVLTEHWRQKISLENVCDCPTRRWISPVGFATGTSNHSVRRQLTYTDGMTEIFGVRDIECPKPPM